MEGGREEELRKLRAGPRFAAGSRAMECGGEARAPRSDPGQGRPRRSDLPEANDSARASPEGADRTRIAARASRVGRVYIEFGIRPSPCILTAFEEGRRREHVDF